MLLDTHVLLWHERFGNRRLGRQARGEIERRGWKTTSRFPPYRSGKSVCRYGKGRLGFGLDVDAWRRDLLDQGLVEIPVDGGIAARAGLLQDMHGDPADRLIVATALEGHRLVTADRGILEWPGRLSRLRATD